MSGIGTVLDIARGALASSSYGIDITGHNIANVNTIGYSRQAPVQETRQPLLYNGLQMGRGVETTEVLRKTEQVIENRLMQQGSKLAYSTERENYVKILEGIFTENAATGVSSLMNDYWNMWHDISNNPSGASERIALNEYSGLLSEKFQTLNADLKQLETDLTRSIGPEIDRINQLTEEIAILNNEIVGMESSSVANDIRDKRNRLVAQVSESIDVKSFEQENGSLTLVSAKGSILVHGNAAYELALGGVNSDRVEWQSSGGNVDITDHISTGKIGGWLDMRDEVVAKYRLDLDALAKGFIWTTNQQLSQGVGLEAFSSLTTGYKTASAVDAMGSSTSGLSFFDKIEDGSFELSVYDSIGLVDSTVTIPVTGGAAGTTLNELAATIDGVANISAAIVDNQLQISAASDYTFAFSDDSSHALAALGINTYFDGNSAGSIGVNDAVVADLNLIAAARLDGSGLFSSGDNTNAISITDLQFAVTNLSQWTCNRLNGNTEGTITTTIEDGYHAMAGSIGAISVGISRERSFDAEMVNSVTQIRDSISAVSLDEEMTNLIKFQHAYSAAAKLISTADEMLVTLLQVK